MVRIAHMRCHFAQVFDVAVAEEAKVDNIILPIDGLNNLVAIELFHYYVGDLEWWSTDRSIGPSIDRTIDRTILRGR